MFDLICPHGIGIWHWIADLSLLWAVGGLYVFHQGRYYCQCFWCKLTGKKSSMEKE